jgi:hypothetical protein
MHFKLMLILSMVAIIPENIEAQTYQSFAEEGAAIMDTLNNIRPILPQNGKNWKVDWRAEEDIKATKLAEDRDKARWAKAALGGNLRSAVAKNKVEDVKTLIAKGADLEVIDYSGMTSLMAAAKNGYTEIVNMLINAGANVDGNGPYCSTPLVYAIENGHTEIAKLLITKAKDSCNWKALTSAINNHHTEIVKLLIANGATKGNQNIFEGYFLDAVSQGDNEMVKAFMIEAANISHLTLKKASMAAKSFCSAEIVNAIEDLQKKTNR